MDIAILEYCKMVVLCWACNPSLFLPNSLLQGSNPLPEDNIDAIGKNNSSEPKRRSAFLEQLRAERESFRAVFDRRRQRIGGLEVDED